MKLRSLFLCFRGFMAVVSIGLLLLSGGRAAVPAATPDHIAGRVTLPDGKLLQGDVRDITVVIYGVTLAGANVTLTPAVGDDGRYRQKVPSGLYSFGTGEVKFSFNNREFILPLEPVGRLWQKRRSADEGMVQDFLLRLTGPTPAGQAAGLEADNSTHWYGVTIGLQWQTHRQDLRAATRAPGGITRLVFTCRPMGPGIDGQPVATLSRELRWDPTRLTPEKILNDLPPADYEISGEAILPDGSRRRLLLQGPADYPNFLPVLKANLTPDRRPFRYQKLNAGFVLE